MSTRGSRLEARNQREPVAQEARVKSWGKRCVCVCVRAMERSCAVERAQERDRREMRCVRERVMIKTLVSSRASPWSAREEMRTRV